MNWKRGYGGLAEGVRRWERPELVILTTWRVSLGRLAVRENARAWGRAAREAQRMPERTRKGVILLAIVSGIVWLLEREREGGGRGRMEEDGEAGWRESFEMAYLGVSNGFLDGLLAKWGAVIGWGG